jgi:hypothetical protein
MSARRDCGIYSKHRDEVADAAEHIRVSGLLDATFSRSLAWPSVVEYEAAGLVYFPVDGMPWAFNTKERLHIHQEAVIAVRIDPFSRYGRHYVV